MAAFFTAASTQYLSANSFPLPSTGYPFTVGMWINLTAVSTVNRNLFVLQNSASTDQNYLAVRMAGTEAPLVAARATGTEALGTSTLVLTAGRWSFVVGQFVSADLRQIGHLHDTGEFVSVAQTANRAPTGMDTMFIGICVDAGGAKLPWNGAIGEFWYTDSDIQPGGAALQAALIRQLAYGGPFSVPHIAKNLVAYRSFRKHPLFGDKDDIYHGRFGAQGWTNNAGVTTSRHPPLPYWYAKPSRPVAASSPRLRFAPTAAAAGQAPRSMHQYRLRRVA